MRHLSSRLLGVTVTVLLAGLLACSDEQPTQPPTPETQSPATGAEPQLAPTPTPPPVKAEGASTAGQSQAQGEPVYKGTCAACHDTGVAGAPKLGDKAAWAPRIAQGEQVMFQHAKAGFQGKTGFMPPKGGNPSLTDAQLQAAIDYMVSKSK